MRVIQNNIKLSKILQAINFVIILWSNENWDINCRESLMRSVCMDWSRKVGSNAEIYRKVSKGWSRPKHPIAVLCELESDRSLGKASARYRALHLCNPCSVCQESTQVISAHQITSHRSNNWLSDISASNLPLRSESLPDFRETSKNISRK